MLKKYCNHTGCTNLIDQSEKYCSKHKTTAAETQKQYDVYVRDKDSKRFLNSKAWQNLRKLALIRDKGMDIVLFMTEGKIVKAEHVHHIIERSENPNKALDIDNTISVSSATHSKISKAYKHSPDKKKKTQDMLFKILNKYKQSIGRGSKKVF